MSIKVCCACQHEENTYVACTTQANHWASQKHPEHVIEEGSEVIFTVHT